LLKQVLPEREILEEFKIKSNHGGHPIIVDLFVPSLSLAIEYNGEYHSKKSANQFFRDNNIMKTKDIVKKYNLQELGYKVIQVSDDWDQKAESLAAILKENLPPDVVIVRPRKRNVLQQQTDYFMDVLS